MDHLRWCVLGAKGSNACWELDNTYLGDGHWSNMASGHPLCYFIRRMIAFLCCYVRLPRRVFHSEAVERLSFKGHHLPSCNGHDAKRPQDMIFSVRHEISITGRWSRSWADNKRCWSTVEVRKLRWRWYHDYHQVELNVTDRGTSSNGRQLSQVPDSLFVLGICALRYSK